MVTSYGKQVAQIGACSAAEPDRKAAREALLARLAAQPVQVIGRWSRDDLYER